MTSALVQPRTFEADGIDYTVRRLNIIDVFTVGRLLSRVLREGGARLSPDFTNEDVMQMLFGGFEFIEQDLLNLCASLIGKKTLDDVPPSVLPTIIECLIEGEDLKAFLDSCKKVMEKAGKLTG